ncbi:hypothetical protein T484DRAFT_1747637 [Baffinella frigidus]|nr:hypothetical protein T484DRAFT_1747637 [Cryptophyta sp. CCMP2293]
MSICFTYVEERPVSVLMGYIMPPKVTSTFSDGYNWYNASNACTELARRQIVGTPTSSLHMSPPTSPPSHRRHTSPPFSPSTSWSTPPMSPGSSAKSSASPSTSSTPPPAAEPVQVPVTSSTPPPTLPPASESVHTPGMRKRVNVPRPCTCNVHGPCYGEKFKDVRYLKKHMKRKHGDQATADTTRAHDNEVRNKRRKTRRPADEMWRLLENATSAENRRTARLDRGA